MSLQQWHKNQWLRPYETSRKQIADLFDIVERDLADASTARLSSDWQFGIAYNAALKLCTILLFAEGYRPDRALAHYRTLQALPFVLGDSRKADADYPRQLPHQTQHRGIRHGWSHEPRRGHRADRFFHRTEGGRPGMAETKTPQSSPESLTLSIVRI